MTVTLCIETSGPHCSLALAANGRRHAVQKQLHRSHNEHLLALLDELYGTAEAEPGDTELVAFGCGPGSFTGVRIAASVCQAVALRADARVVPLSSSIVLAATALAANPSLTHVTVSILSRGEAFYLSQHVRDAHGGVMQTREDELVTAVPDWLSPQAFIAGQLPPWLVADHPLSDVSPSAVPMIDMALAQHAAGLSRAPELALPRYFAGDSPWRKQAG